MPYLKTVSPSLTNQMSTSIHYHTTLTATWKSDYVYDVVLSITREEAGNPTEAGWNVTNSHKYRFIYYDKNGNLVDTGRVSLAGKNVKVTPTLIEGVKGWPSRTAEIYTWTIETHPTKRYCIAEYYAELDNTKYGGTYEQVSFWAPSSNIANAPLLPDGPNVYVRSGGNWKQAKDIYIYKDGEWVMVPTGDMNVRKSGTWKS